MDRKFVQEDGIDKREIRQQFNATLGSPFLYTGVMLEVFQAVGTMPVERDRLYAILQKYGSCYIGAG